MPGVILELVAVKDPLAGPGVPPRDEILRLRALLKTALRCHGYRCRGVFDVTKVEVVVREVNNATRPSDVHD